MFAPSIPRRNYDCQCRVARGAEVESRKQEIGDLRETEVRGERSAGPCQRDQPGDDLHRD